MPTEIDDLTITGGAGAGTPSVPGVTIEDLLKASETGAEKATERLRKTQEASTSEASGASKIVEARRKEAEEARGAFKEYSEEAMTSAQAEANLLPEERAEKLKASRDRQSERIAALEASGKYSARDLIAEILPLVIGTVGSGVTGGKLALGQFAKNQMVARAAETARKFESKERRLGEAAEEGRGERTQIRAEYANKEITSKNRLSELADQRSAHMLDIEKRARAAGNNAELQQVILDAQVSRQDRRILQELQASFSLESQRRALLFLATEHVRLANISEEQRRAERDNKWAVTSEDKQLWAAAYKSGIFQTDEATGRTWMVFADPEGGVQKRELGVPGQHLMTQEALIEKISDHIDYINATQPSGASSKDHPYGTFFEPSGAKDPEGEKIIASALNKDAHPWAYAHRRNELALILYKRAVPALNIVLKNMGSPLLPTNYEFPRIPTKEEDALRLVPPPSLVPSPQEPERLSTRSPFPFLGRSAPRAPTVDEQRREEGKAKRLRENLDIIDNAVLLRDDEGEVVERYGRR